MEEEKNTEKMLIKLVKAPPRFMHKCIIVYEKLFTNLSKNVKWKRTKKMNRSCFFFLHSFLSIDRRCLHSWCFLSSLVPLVYRYQFFIILLVTHWIVTDTWLYAFDMHQCFVMRVYTRQRKTSICCQWNIFM